MRHEKRLGAELRFSELKCEFLILANEPVDLHLAEVGVGVVNV